MRLTKIESHSISDTRKKPTIETTLFSDSVSATASVPSGKSTGSHEAFELRDARGSVDPAIANVTGEIAQALVGKEFDSPDALDAFLVELDGTANKSRLGANALLSVSIAATRLFASLEGVPLWRAVSNRAQTLPSTPRLYVNVMNGGAHADFRLPFQEYLLVVEGSMGTALPIAEEAFAKVGELLGANVPMGDEGGFAPSFQTLEEPFELLAKIVAEFPGTSIAIDAAASELFRDGAYQMLGESYTPERLLQTYEGLVSRFPLHSIEDPFAENAGENFAQLTSAVSGKTIIVGDDLTVTDPVRIKKAIAGKEITAVLMKPNQIGTVREALLAVTETYAAGLVAVASHRSGETHDTFIADFAYGIGAHGLKAGGFGQPERAEKYARLRAIEREAESV